MKKQIIFIAIRKFTSCYTTLKFVQIMGEKYTGMLFSFTLCPLDMEITPYKCVKLYNFRINLEMFQWSIDKMY